MPASSECNYANVMLPASSEQILYRFNHCSLPNGRLRTDVLLVGPGTQFSVGFGIDLVSAYSELTSASRIQIFQREQFSLLNNDGVHLLNWAEHHALYLSCTHNICIK